MYARPKLTYACKKEGGGWATGYGRKELLERFLVAKKGSLSKESRWKPVVKKEGAVGPRKVKTGSRLTE